jgi:predicted NAD/FAD-binding protein
MKVAVIGSGISGLAASHALREHADVTLFEAGRYFGGHTHTVDVTLPGPDGLVTHGVDTGFLVFNERTYPQLIALLAELGVATTASEMSFSVQAPAADGRRIEWSGSSLSSLFAQRSNAVSPRFLRMVADLIRFNALATRIAAAGDDSVLRHPLGSFLDRHGFSREFRDWYLLPMLGCIWSCPTDQMLRFPVATMIRFCHNHGLLQITRRPQWYTVVGGARNYVNSILAGIADKRLNTPVWHVRRDDTGATVMAADGVHRFDKVVIATHPDQALSLLADADAEERRVLGAIRYAANRAVLHTDASVLPQSRRAWAAWNYERAEDTSRESASVCLHYLINRLQPLPFSQPVIVSLNPVKPIPSAHVLGSYDYEHPVFDMAAIRAQQDVPSLQGRRNAWFAGAWTGYGFHEDGLKSGLSAARQICDEVYPLAEAA